MRFACLLALLFAAPVGAQQFKPGDLVRLKQTYGEVVSVKGDTVCYQVKYDEGTSATMNRTYCRGATFKRDFTLLNRIQFGPLTIPDSARWKAIAVPLLKPGDRLLVCAYQTSTADAPKVLASLTAGGGAHGTCPK